MACKIATVDMPEVGRLFYADIRQLVDNRLSLR
jgi:hypothetical protein